MTITATQLIALIEAWLWPFLRVGALLMAAPVIGTRTVPVRIRMVLTVALTMVLVPVLPMPKAIDPFTAQGIAIGAQQILIGVVLGLCVRLIFMAFEIAGQIVAQQMGLSFATLVDPQSGTQVAVISQFYVMFATLLFLTMNGHLLLIRALTQSFSTLPIGGSSLGPDAMKALVMWGGELITQGVMIALPAIAALLIVNLAFGVMARAAPQLNIFAVGFPISILVGTVIVWLTLSGMQAHLQTLMDSAFSTAGRILSGH